MPFGCCNSDEGGDDCETPHNDRGVVDGMVHGFRRRSTATLPKKRCGTPPPPAVAATAFVLVALLRLTPAASQPTTTTACTAAQFQTDTCAYQYDGVCDAGTACNAGTDCFDCDPCHAYRFEGCATCTAAGCLWCGQDATCVTDGSTLLGTMSCNASDFVSTCDGTSTTSSDVFADPFYDADVWIYNLINIQDVWKSGISKSTRKLCVSSRGQATKCTLFFPLLLIRSWGWDRHSHQRSGRRFKSSRIQQQVRYLVFVYFVYPSYARLEPQSWNGVCGSGGRHWQFDLRGRDRSRCDLVVVSRHPPESQRSQ